MTIEELELENLLQFQERELKDAKDTIEKLMKEKLELIKSLKGCNLPHFVLTKPQYRLFLTEDEEDKQYTKCTKIFKDIGGKNDSK